MTGERVTGRRLAGVLVLVLALGGIALVNGVSATRVAGNPVAVWPQPPPVGSCVNTQGGFAVVACDGPHDAEVTAAHGPLDPMVTDTARDPMYDPCDAAARAYLGVGAGGGAEVPGAEGWRTVGLAYAVQPVTAPPDQRAGRFGWQICVIHPAVPARYTGTVRGATVQHAPQAYRTCMDTAGGTVSCTWPHAGELLAVGVSSSEPLSGLAAAAAASLADSDSAGGPDPRDPAAAVERAEQRASAARSAALLALQLERNDVLLRAEGCPEVAAWVLGTDDPSYGGMLSIRADVLGTGTAVVREADPSGAAQQAIDGQPAPVEQGHGGVVAAVGCTVRAPEGRDLNGSVVGQGDQPPVLTGG